MVTRSTRTTRLLTRSNHLPTGRTGLFTRNNRLSIRLSIRNTCLSARSTYNNYLSVFL